MMHIVFIIIFLKAIVYVFVWPHPFMSKIMPKSSTSELRMRGDILRISYLVFYQMIIPIKFFGWDEKVKSS